MNVAFYAPLKPPTHPVPSGDRYIARGFIRALRRCGHQVDLASRFRSREGLGDPDRQRRLERTGRRTVARILARYRCGAAPPAVWFTYHLYHKAPDFLGPVVSRALGIPYVVAEASHAPKRRRGPWSAWHALAAEAIGSAAAVLVLNSDDMACLAPVLAPRARVERIGAFIDTAPYARATASATRPSARAALAAAHGLDPAAPWVLAVGMMRADRKLDCYRVLAAAARLLPRSPWSLVIAGDGEARGAVEEAFAGLGSGRVAFLGARAPREMPALYTACDVFAWPAVGEPLGLVFLEAQAAGLPVVGGATRGVPDLVRNAETGVLVREGDPQAFARALAGLLGDPERRRSMGARGAEVVSREHDLSQAARRLDAILRGVVDGRR